jgi:hypothetical protein
MHRTRRSFGVALLATVVATGCGNSSQVDTPEVNASEDWVTIDGVEFPVIMAQVPADIVEIYVFAAKHPEVLEYIPCYCGCEDETPPHISAYDCFVDAIDRSGPVPRVEIDLMGFG